MTRPIGIPRGKSDSSRAEVKPEVTTVVPSVTRRPRWTKSSSRSSGWPTSGLTMPVAPSGITWAETALEASVISVTSDGAAGDPRDLADQAAGGDHRLVDLDAVAGALVDLDARVPDGGRAGDHPRGHRLGARPGTSRVVQVDDRPQLRGVALGRLGLGHLLAQRARPRPSAPRSRPWRRSCRRTSRTGRAPA